MENLDHYLNKCLQPIDNNTLFIIITKLYLGSPSEKQKIKNFIKDNIDNCNILFLKAWLYGRKKKYDKAINFYKKSGKSGNYLAYNNLGKMWEEGKGVCVDYKKAMKYYLKSINGNTVEGYNNIGNMYLHGKGIDKNVDKAKEYFEKALSINPKYAISLTNLGFLYEKIRDYDNAIKYYTKGASLGEKTAMWNLGNLYENGLGVAPNIKLALIWYQGCADCGDSQAEKKVKILKQKIKSIKSNLKKEMD